MKALLYMSLSPGFLIFFKPIPERIEIPQTFPPCEPRFHSWKSTGSGMSLNKIENKKDAGAPHAWKQNCFKHESQR